MTDKEQKRIFSMNLTSYLGNKSQIDVAKAIGVSPQTFNTWCQGIAMPRMGKLQLLADYFGIEKSDLIDDKSKKKNTSVSLNEDIYYIIDKYNSLNDTGKAKLKNYIDDLMGNPVNTKTTQKKEA